MASIPKTPSRYRSRSDAKTPLTPSLVASFNAVSLGSPKKHAAAAHFADISNPFLARSRPSSPVKRTTSSTTNAAAGVIRKGGVESRLDVVSHDYRPPAQPSRPELKRSRSTPSTRERTLSHSSSHPHADRFITTREEPHAPSSFSSAATSAAPSSSPGHTARLANAAGVPLNKRVLAYHEPPPSSSSSSFLATQRTHALPLLRGAELPSSNGTWSSKSRRVPTNPERVLDAPGMVDDFYLNLVAWSALNVVGVALGESTYIWNADTGTVSHLGDAPDHTYVASVDFSNDGAYLGVGLGTGAIELWDVQTGQKLRTMQPSSDATSGGQVASLSWFNHVLTSGHSSGSIHHHDVRAPRHLVTSLHGHTGEVCGLKWSTGGEVLASGGNDNVVNLWDGRGGDVGAETRGAPKWTKRNHTAAVKALSFSPWSQLLASGGGTSDTCIHIWNTSTGARLHTYQTGAQVTGIHWARDRKELVSCHGFPGNAIIGWGYPPPAASSSQSTSSSARGSSSGSTPTPKLFEIRDAHDSRVLFSALSPNGEVLVTGAGDENLKFWRIWEAKETKSGSGGSRRAGKKEDGSVARGILGIR
ncbi:quinon protein alcohol dehydrogenase-like superfamily [Phlebopus sp. FC_14]|nr:quinon protein alcohol dehydrogenase-like superfamily [Phlebopus sp. FC_14]